MNPVILTRIRALALGWGSVGLAYNLAQFVQGRGTVIAETALDRLIPFSSHGIWLYLSFFALIPAAYALVEHRRLTWLTRSMQLCALVCAIVFVAWPTTLTYPPVTGHSPSDITLRFLAANDSSQNCLPSLHAALTLLSVWAMADSRRPWRSIPVALWGLGIGYAIVQTRRHLALDLSAGVLLAVVCGHVSSRLYAENLQ